MSSEELKELAGYIAEELIKAGVESNGEQWVEEDNEDHWLGELARCVTLQNLYLEREEYEKCAVMKARIQMIAKKLDIDEESLS